MTLVHRAGVLQVGIPHSLLNCTQVCRATVSAVMYSNTGRKEKRVPHTEMVDMAQLICVDNPAVSSRVLILWPVLELLGTRSTEWKCVHIEN